MAPNKRFIAFILLVLFSSSGPIAPESAIVPDFLLTPDNTRLLNEYSDNESFSAAEKNINNFIYKWSIKGASVAVAKDGKLLYAKGFGVIDTASKETVQPYHRFRVASISKLVTAVAIMKLCEEGKLSVNDKVFGPTGILNDPYFSKPKDKRVYDITVENLLIHEGGWSQRYGDQMFMPITVAEKMGVKPPADTKTIVRYALDKNLHFTPGKSTSYSNLGYSILGLVIEKVTGIGYEEYCKREVLEPLGIFDMCLAHNLESEKAPYEVTYYTQSDVTLIPSIYGTNELVAPNYGGNDIEALGGAGAWLATPMDLMRLMLAVDGFDEYPDILSPESIVYMTDKARGAGSVGWKSTVAGGTWTRTGSFLGTVGVMRREADGTEWVVLLNSSSWNGPQLYSYVNSTMSKFIRQVDEWPETDLFDHYMAVPLMADFN